MTTSSRNDPTRRGALAVLGAGAALPLLGRPALALTTAEARALIDRVVSDINRIINSGRSEQAMYRDFEGIFDRYADVPTIARAALGPAARTASPAQLRAFGDAFGVYLARKYGARFREFIGGEIRVQEAEQIRSYFEVKTLAVLRGQAPFRVSFMVSDRSGRNRFFDLVIEGVSLLTTERTEIGAMLDRRRGNVDQLIADLRATG